MNFKTVLCNNIKLLKYVIKFAPELFFWRSLLAIVGVVLNLVAGVGFMKFLTDAIEYKYSFNRVIICISIIGASYLVNSLLNSLFNYYYNYLGKRKIHLGMHEMIFNIVKYVDLDMYDNSEFYNNYIWALKEVDTRTITSFENLMKFIQSIANLSGILTISYFLDMGIIVFGIVPMALTMFLSNKISCSLYKCQDEMNPVERKKDYTKRIFYQLQYAKELKMFNIGENLIDRFKKCIVQCINIYKKYCNKLIFLSFCQDATGTLIGTACFSIYLAYKAIVLKTISIGTVTASFNAVNILTASLGNLFAIYPKLKENALFANKIFYILNYESKIEARVGQSLQKEKMEYIEFKNVYFRYPKDNNYILKNINFKVRKGEKIAIVGLNGAGKTTLVKLLLNFYNPTSGLLEYNGKDIRVFTTSEYRKIFSTIFQDFQLYALSLIENIIMRPVYKTDYVNAEKCLRKSNMSKYCDDLYTEVTKEFDENGLIFSGGQNQKIAIARAISQNGQCLIMDEASSALDPIAENEINNTILEKNNGNTVIIISHRLSSITYVDKIYYMEDGMIIEQGTHQQLMRMDGKYAYMYKAQADRYKC